MGISSVASPTFKKDLTTSYNLSILIRQDGLSFSVLDFVTNTFVAYGNTDLPDIDPNFAKQEELLLTTPLLSATYRQVTVCIENPSFTLVPKQLYDAARSRELLNFVGLKAADDDVIVVDNIELADAMLVYAVPQFLYYFLANQFSHPRLMNAVLPSIEVMLTKREVVNAKKYMVRVALSHNAVGIIVAEANALKLCNSFACCNANDFVYIVMNTLEQMSVNTADAKIIVSGNIADKDARVSLLRRFAHNVELAKLPDYFNYGFQKPNKEYKFATLFTMPLCE